MAVGTDDAVACGDHTLFRKQGMFDAHFANVIKVTDTVAAGKFPTGLTLLRRLNVFIGNKVVKNNGNSVFVKNPVKSGFFEFIHRHGSGNVVAKDDVQLCADELSCCYLVQSRMGGKNFLCHGHSHGINLPLPYCGTH